MRRKLRPPLPQRHGLDPARLRLPAHGPWTTIRDHLVERLPMVGPERIDAMLRECAIVDLDGPIAPDAPFVPDSSVWFHRDLPVEVPVPFEIDVVHRDEDILVVDKPHFLATIPRGKHIVETALVRLRRQLDLPDALPRPPARPGHRRTDHVRGPPRPQGRLPDPVPGPVGAQGLRGDRAGATPGSTCRARCAAGSSRSAG